MRRANRTIVGIGTSCIVLLLSGCISINLPPVASFTATPQSGWAPLDVSFDGSASSDSDGEVVKLEWDFGDDTTDLGPVTTHTYNEPGTYLVELQVTDGGGLKGSRVQLITVREGILIVDWELQGDILGARVRGTARNMTGKTLASAEILAIFKNAQGDEVTRGTDQEVSIAPDEIWEFSISVVAPVSAIASAEVRVNGLVEE